MDQVAYPAAVDALTADGMIVRLRSVRPDDADSLVDLHQRGTPESLRMRFFSAATASTIAGEVERLLRPPAQTHDAVVAEQDGSIVGVASYERQPERSPSAEFAVFVDVHQHGRGVGTLLLEFLAARARRQGIQELIGDVLATNAPMLRIAREHLGGRSAGQEYGVVGVRLLTASDEAALAEMDSRDRASRVASLRPLLEPRSVAVIGAGRDPSSIGTAILRSMVDFGFTGRLCAVNRFAHRILDVDTYADLANVPYPIDLAVICVHAEAVPDVLSTAGAHGVRAAIVVSAGFGEAGDEGRWRQAELVAIARRHGIRLVGPNCLGALNTDPAIRLAATFAPILPPTGGLALASQSGAVGVTVLEAATRAGSGLSSFVSLGNKADVSGNDLLSFWYDDPATSAVALYLESFGNPRRFARVARAVARRKPVIAVVSGRSAAGRRAGASHTAAAASPALAVDSLCQQAGIIRVEHLGELLDVARVVTDQPLPDGARLAVMGNAGGVNVLAADAAEAAGLSVAGQPLDLGAGADAMSYHESLERILASGEADMVLAVVAATRANDVEAILATVASAVDRYPQVPVTVVVLGAAGEPTLGQRRVPVFDLPERAVAALGKAAWYAGWRRAPLGTRPVLPNVDTEGARGVVRRALAARPGWQPHARVAGILSRYGIPMVGTTTVVGEKAAVATAERIGYPVVLKAADPALVHKSDLGVVKVQLGSAADVIAAYRAVAAALDHAEPAVLVQPMVLGELELAAGIVHDAQFGSLVMLGLGGIHIDIFSDRAFHLVPLTDTDATQMWQSLRAAPLLTGYRGSQPVNTAAVEDLLLRLGRLAEDLPEVAELDLNPVIVSARRAAVVDAKLRLESVGYEPDAALRSLLG